MKSKKLLIVCFVWFLSAICFGQVNGSLDTTFYSYTSFGPDKSASFKAQLNPDGSWWVMGTFNWFSGFASQGLVQVSGTGEVDTSFSVSGLDKFVFQEVRKLPNGKVLARGEFAIGGEFGYRIIQLMPDGSLDPGFLISSFRWFYDPKILSAGIFNYEQNQLRKYDFNGTEDTTFTNRNMVINHLTDFPNGRMLAVRGMSSHDLIVLNNDGTLDTSFSRIQFNIINYMPFENYLNVHQNGTIWLLKRSTNQRLVLQKFNQNGQSMPLVNPTVSFGTRAYLMQADDSGRVQVSWNDSTGHQKMIWINEDGQPIPSSLITLASHYDRLFPSQRGYSLFESWYSDFGYGGERFAIKHFDLAGNLYFTKEGEGFNGRLSSIVPRKDGKFYALGDFSRVAGFHSPFVARFFANGRIDTSFKAFRNSQILASSFGYAKGDIGPNGLLLVKQNSFQRRFYLFKENGEIDNQFTVNQNFKEAHFLEDGKIIAWADSASVKPKFYRLLLNGNVDTTFVSPELEVVDSLQWLVQRAGFYKGRSGRYFFELSRSSYIHDAVDPGQPEPPPPLIHKIWRFNPDMSLDSTFNLINEPGGKIFSFDEDTNGAVMTICETYHSNFHSESGAFQFGTEGQNPIYDPSSDPLKPLQAAVLSFSPAGGLLSTTNEIHAYCTNGLPDPRFQTPVMSDHQISAFVQVDSTHVLVAGDFNHVNGKPIGHLFKMYYKQCSEGITTKNTTSSTVEKGIFLHPNPGKDQVLFSHKLDMQNIQVFNTNGQLVCNFKIDQNAISTAHFPKGMYLFRISVGGKVHSLRWMKE